MKPILVHVHIFYAELWPELKLCLSNISEYPYELYVTMVQENETLVNCPDASHEENLAHELEIALGTSVAAQNYDIRYVFTPDVESKMKWGTILGRLRRKL